MRFTRISILWLAAVLVLSTVAFAGPEARLMRFPDIHGDKVVFCYAGDLWLVDAGGGIARQITTHEGLERFPRFSPDGEYIAFSGEYDGNIDVYVMPAEGGEPRRLTYRPEPPGAPGRMGFDDMVIDWFPDGKSILFRSRREVYTDWLGRLYQIGIAGGLPKLLEIPYGGFSSFSPDGKRLAYNRVMRDFRTWKRYRGGMAQDIWIWDFGAHSIEQITTDPATDHFPMWMGDRIYFVSDRDLKEEIFCCDLGDGAIRKITDSKAHDGFDVRWPGCDTRDIVYEAGGYLYILNTSTEKTRKIRVEIPGDRPLTRPRLVSVKDNITDYNLSATGKRALFGARGEVFTVPPDKGNTRNLTRTSGARETSSRWSPDGKWVSYISDVTGEEEIYIIPQDGKSDPIQITTGGNADKFIPYWSPDSKKMVYADKNLRLYWVDIDKKKVHEIDRSGVWEIRSYSWSPDSKWITYAKFDNSFFGSIYLYNLGGGRITRVTGPGTDDSGPVFDPGGKYLYYISERDFSPQMVAFESNFMYDELSRVYLVTLQADTPSPFAPESDEEEPKAEKDEKKDKEDEDKAEETPDVRIDLKGIAEREVALPIDPGNIYWVIADEGKVFYFKDTGEGNPDGALHVYDLEEKEDEVVISGVSGVDFSHDRKKVIYSSDRTYGITDAKAGASVGDGKLDLGGLEMMLDPREEWRQMFHEAWRFERDYFYDPNMHGYDWDALRAQYEPLVEHVAHRYDLTYVIGEMISELCCSHTYCGGGDMPRAERVDVGLLGVDFELDPRAGLYRFKRILPGNNWTENLRSPLTEPGVNVEEGEYLIEVNGTPLRHPTNPYSLFQNTVGTTVTLKVNRKPQPKGAREVEVKPIADENYLRYTDWLETNQRIVDEATNGRVGYLHIPDMSLQGLSEWAKRYYAQIRKEGLIIDVRANGGGFVSEMILERLRRQVMGMSAPRNSKNNFTYPPASYYGHLVCLCDQYSASDGDYFPHYFQEYGLGPVIGRRTWGGIVGIRGFARLVDGGYVTKPEIAGYAMDSRWMVENHGVDPDIVVDNRPDLVARGHDPQLEKGIEVILDLIRKDPKKLPERPDYETRP
ncbi:MAG: PD40 domain-containing protein [Candidatus Eisenbacteria sp.]|nr:PD40 domain-containing protein [Candidatus Eisenbacteria bacterium]